MIYRRVFKSKINKYCLNSIRTEKAYTVHLAADLSHILQQLTMH
jgi:hypothetical protein